MGKITLALVLIVIGALILLRNLGQLSQSWWQMAIKLWPLVLVFIGVEILLTRKGHSTGKGKRG